MLEDAQQSSQRFCIGSLLRLRFSTTGVSTYVAAGQYGPLLVSYRHLAKMMMMMMCCVSFEFWVQLGPSFIQNHFPTPAEIRFPISLFVFSRFCFDVFFAVADVVLGFPTTALSFLSNRTEAYNLCICEQRNLNSVIKVITMLFCDNSDSEALCQNSFRQYEKRPDILKRNKKYMTDLVDEIFSSSEIAKLEKIQQQYPTTWENRQKSSRTKAATMPTADKLYHPYEHFLKRKGGSQQLAKNNPPRKRPKYPTGFQHLVNTAPPLATNPATEFPFHPSMRQGTMCMGNSSGSHKRPITLTIHQPSNPKTAHFATLATSRRIRRRRCDYY